MDEFTKNIVSQYEQEVEPLFDDTKWDSFVLFRQSISRRKRRRVFVFLFFAVSLLGGFIFLSRDGRMGYSPGESVGPTLSESEPGISSNTLNAIPQGTINGTVADTSYEQLIKITSSDHIERSVTRIDEDEKYPDLFEDGGPDKVKTQPLPRVVQGFAPIEGKSFFMDSKPLSIREFNEKIDSIAIEDESPMDVGLEVYAGVDIPNHRLTYGENGYHFGSRLYVPLQKNTYLRGGIQISNLNYKSHIMSGEIGVVPIEAPGENFNFSQAVVEDLVFDLHIGGDYFFGARNHSLRPFVGLGYQMRINLIHDVDYEFMGTEIDLSPSDIIVSRSGRTGVLESYIGLRTGLSLNSPIGSVLISCEKNLKINDPASNNFKNLELSLGLLYHF